MLIPLRLNIGIFLSLLVLLAALFFIPSTPMARYHNEIENGRILGASERLPESTLVSLMADYSMLPENKDVEAPVAPPKAPVLLNISPRPETGEYWGVVIDTATDAELWGRDPEEVRPVASLSKLATALVFLDNNPGWDEIYTLSESDRVEGGRIYLLTGEPVRLRDLFNLSLVASANTATMALAHSTGMSTEEFVAEMNAKALQLGLKNTRYGDPVGLSADNVSTAHDIALLLKAALAQKEIRETVAKKGVEFMTEDGSEKTAYTTDLLLNEMSGEGYNIIGGKTGYTKLAGYCFVGCFSDSAGHEVITVVLGADDPNARFEEAKKLTGWAYDNYRWND